MPIKWSNSNNYFGLRARSFHYVALTCVLVLVAIGFGAELLPKGWRGPAMATHKLIGFCMVWLMTGWIVSFALSRAPLAPADIGAFKRLAARIVKIALMVAVLVMGLSGWGMSVASGHAAIPRFGLTLPAPFALDPAWARSLWKVHETTALILISLVAVHVVAALYHHFIRKDGVFVRMFPFVSHKGK
jgi:cytochrome b561